MLKILVKLRSLDQVTKVGCLLLITVFSYIALLFILKPVFIRETSVAPHTTVMGDHLMVFSSAEQRNLNLAAIIIAILVGCSIWALLRGSKQEVQDKVNQPIFDIVKKILSEDEKKLLKEVQMAGEITQDSLRFRLNWSKAKVSAVLLQLDRMNLVQRVRQGKTYNVIVSKK